MSTGALGIGQGKNAVFMPDIQLSGLFVFVIYAVLNFDPLTEFYLDYKEAKSKQDPKK